MVDVLDLYLSPTPLARRALVRAGPVGSLLICRRDSDATQRFERGTKFSDEKLRLFPRREVTAFIELVVIDKLGISPLCPTPRGLIDLVRKGAHRDRDDDVFRCKEGELVFPINTRRRDRRVRQPVAT